jgi:polyribonucleotide nucleotidyltransferase
VRGSKTAVLILSGSLMLVSCAKPKPNAHIAALFAAKDSIERVIEAKSAQAQEARKTSAWCWQQAGSVVPDWRSLETEQKLQVQKTFSKAWQKEHEADSLEKSAAESKAQLEKKREEIKAAEEKGWQVEGVHFINQVFAPIVISLFGAVFVLTVISMQIENIRKVVRRSFKKGAC